MRRAIGGVTAAALVSLLVVAAAPAAGAVDEPVTQWNIQGGCAGGGNCGGPLPVNTLVYLVTGANPRPWAITLNEVCFENQYLSLQSQLSQLGYLGLFTPTNNDTDCGSPTHSGYHHGNAIFQLGAYVEQTDEIVLPTQTAGADTRKLRCRTANVLGLLRRACVTHLDPTGPAPFTMAKTTSQNNEAVWILSGSIGSTATSFGGDLNLANPPSWGTNWRPVGGGATHPSNAPTSKIDHMFGSKVGHTASGWPGIYCNSGVSDHCLITGKHTS